MNSLIAASVAFVGLHFLLSHPLRAPLVKALGARGFLGLYAGVALFTFFWTVRAFGRIEPQPLWWVASDAVWLAASVAMLVGAVLFVGSLFGNPAFPNPAAHEPAVPTPRGVFAITRHPMMWGFALWALVHLIVFPTDANAVLTGAILILALVGAWAQDRKKQRLQPGSWPEWKKRTSYFPFAAQVAGKAPWTLGDGRALIGGAALWLVATKLHIVLGGAMEAGIWRWVSIG
jgi:uncharacterized membrane protein